MSDAFVWHFVLTRGKQPKSAGERLGTACLPPELVERVGMARIRAAIEDTRREWARKAAAAGYRPVDGYAVNVIPERGFRRSLFPVAAAIQIVDKPPLIVLGGEKGAH